MLTTETTPALLRMDEAARYLGMSERYLADLVARNAIPSLTVGRLRRFDRRRLDDWIASGCPTRSGAAASVGEARR